MSEFEIRTELKKAFDIFDKDEVGFINAEEFTRVISFIGIDNKTINLSDYLQEIDDEISRELFIKIIMDKLYSDASNITYKEINFAFKLLDVDETGYITNRNLAKLLRKLDDPPTEDEITAIIKRFDIHGKGEINYDDLNDRMRLQVEKNINNTEN